MQQDNVVQCQVCGELHRVKMRFKIDDNLFMNIMCPRCRNETSHLLIGNYEDDVYLYGNCNLDKRYFEYKTK